MSFAGIACGFTLGLGVLCGVLLLLDPNDQLIRFLALLMFGR